MCLAFVMNLGTAWAQNSDVTLPPVYDPGNPVTEFAAGQKVSLTPAGGTSYNPGKYMAVSGTTADAATLTAVDNLTGAAVWVVESTGKTVDNHPTWRLKNEATGLYILKSSSVLAGEDDGLVKFTTDANSSFEFTALHPLEEAQEGTEAGTENPRQSWAVGNANQTFVADSWILAEGTFTARSQVYLAVYLSYSLYRDTNEWTVAEVTELTDYAAVLQTALASEMPNGMAAYPEGTGPGTYDKDAVAALKTAYDAAMLVAGKTSATKEECNAAYADYYKAKQACDATLKKLEDGKYYFITGHRNNDGLFINTSNTLVGTSNYAIPAADAAKVNDSRYIFKAEAAGDGTFYFQNYYTQLYVGATTTQYTAQPTTATPSVKFTMTASANANYPGTFTVTGGGAQWHVQASGTIVVNYAGSDGPCLFSFTPADDVVTALAGKIEQEKLNTALDALYTTASASYNKGRNFTSADATADGNFDKPGLVTDAANLSTNAQEPSEGPIADLLDGDFSTYFHSQWNTTDAPTSYHYIQADLGKAVSSFEIKYAMRYRSSADPQRAPKVIRVYATNTPDAADSWNLCGVYSLSYTYPAAINNGEEVENAAGLCPIDLTNSYRYVRLEVRETIAGGTNNGFPFFYWSELRFYDAAYSASASPEFEAVDKTVRDNLSSALTKAAGELNAEKATQPTIDELQSAYDAWTKEFADMDVLKNAVAAAKTVAQAEGLPVGTGLGEYSQDALDELNSVIETQEALLSSTLTLDQINAAVKTLNDAVNAFKNSLVLPELGKIYTLRGMTSDAANTRAVNAPIYAVNNSTTAYLKSLQQNDGMDAIEAGSFLNMLWKVEAVGNGQITLRNIGTGFYIGKQETLNGAVPNVPEPTSIGIQSCNLSGGFNLIVGESRYVNYQGAGENMVAWRSANGSDNSAIKFEEFNADDYFGSTNWYIPTTAGPSILTLPFAIDGAGFGDTGTAYDVLGIRNEGEDWSVELQEISDEIPAGTPFVFVPNTGSSSFVTAANRTYLPVILSATSLDEIEYAATPVASANGKLVGTIAAMTGEGSDVIPFNSVIFSNGSPLIVGANSSAARLVAAENSGYITWKEGETITDEGDFSIALPGSITSGIGNVTFEDANAKVNVYTITGVKVRQNVKSADATNGLPVGIYVVGGKKVLVK